jgi:hypothetical protein
MARSAPMKGNAISLKEVYLLETEVNHVTG